MIEPLWGGAAQRQTVGLPNRAWCHLQDAQDAAILIANRRVVSEAGCCHALN
jgi:hypothetical protein